MKIAKESSIEEIADYMNARKVKYYLENLKHSGCVVLTDKGEALLSLVQGIGQDDFGLSLSENDRERAKRLRAWRKQISIVRNVSPFVIMTNHTLFKLAEKHPTDVRELSLFGVKNSIALEFGDMIIGCLDLLNYTIFHPQTIVGAGTKK